MASQAEAAFPGNDPEMVLADEIIVVDEGVSRHGERAVDVPVLLRELAAVAALVVLCDATIYRGAGFAGIALLLLSAPALLWLGIARPQLTRSVWIIGGMLLLLAARMLWLGSILGVVVGLGLLLTFGLTLHGFRPYVPASVVYGLQTVTAGFFGLLDYRKRALQLKPIRSRVLWSFVLPLLVVLGFGSLFVLANPDLVDSFVKAASHYLRQMFDWLDGITKNWLEMAFWIVVAWVSIGLVRPKLSRLALFAREKPPTAEAPASQNSPAYAELRNTLVAVIALFAIYLLYEFGAVWFRTFPAGSYSGYAHEGAAWLTAALALSTLVLSLIFRGGILSDPRVARLRKLAWIWSAENFVLAITVYNRMNIYIKFNGMTHMRIIGLYGMTAVVIGFCFVLLKIVRQRDAIWLMHRHLWTLSVVVYLYALTPVDALAHSYNVRHVLAGDLPPAVQISTHPIDAEGFLVLHPLVHCEDSIIRDGIRALLAERAIEAQAAERQNARLGWTTYQIADKVLLESLEACRDDWEMYLDGRKRAETLELFHRYVYQWY